MVARGKVIVGNDHDWEIGNVLRNAVLAWEGSLGSPKQPLGVVAAVASGQGGEESVVQTYCSDQASMLLRYVQ